MGPVTCTTILTIDIYQPYINPRATEIQAVRFGRLMGVVMICVGILWSLVLIAHSNKPIFIYLLNAYGYVTPGIATIFLLGIFWKRATQAGALTAGLITIPLSVAIEKLTPLLAPALAQYITPFWNRTGIVFWTCILAGIIVSLLTTPKPEQEISGLIWTKESLKLPEAMRLKMRGLKNPVYWWAFITIVVLYFYVRYH